MSIVSHKSYRETQNKHFILTNFVFRKLCLLWENLEKYCRAYFFFSKIVPFVGKSGKNIVEPGRPQMTIWHMRTACWIPLATNAHSEYVILFCFSTATVVARTPLHGTLYVKYRSSFILQ